MGVARAAIRPDPVPNTETAIMHHIQLAVSEAGHVCFRANVGLFFTEDGRPARTGLPRGFSDLFGYTSGLRPFFLEVKTATGRVRPEQKLFIEAMRNRGAIAGVVRSIDDALLLLGGDTKN
jgi:hypothetical protein